MPVARVYLPATPALIEALRTQRELAAEQSAVAVAPGAPEDVEYAAWSRAAIEAGELAASAGRRRVVLSADVDVRLLEPAPLATPTAVVITAPVPMKWMVSAHVDEQVGSDLADLLWYDITELDDVAALLLG